MRRVDLPVNKCPPGLSDIYHYAVRINNQITMRDVPEDFLEISL
jgi:hypothetical protein